jgi:hypothetical protein
MTTLSPNAAAIDALLDASSNTGDVPLVTYNWNPATQLGNYLAAQANVIAGVAGTEAEIIAVGDSTTVGYNAAATDYRPTVSYPADLAVFLSQDGVAAQGDNFLGQGNEDSDIPDSRITLFGAALWNPPFLAGGPAVVTYGIGEGFTFTLPTAETYNRVNINYLDSGGGTLNVALNGGATVATLQIGNTGLMVSRTIDLPIGVYSSVSVTTGTANQTQIEGVSFSNTVTPAIQVLNAGVGGAESSVVGDGVTPGAGMISSPAALGANLALINFGINDILQGNLTATQTTANIALMVTEFRANRTDPIIIIPQPINSANYVAEIPTLRADIYQLATTMNVPVIDLSATYNADATSLLADGLLTNDGIHPGATLLADIASGIATLLANGSSSVPVPPVVTPPVVTPPVATPPDVTLSPAPTVANGDTATLGTVTGPAGDTLSVALISDATIQSGSSLALSNGTLIYTPGAFTAAQAGADTLTYNVIDTTAGAVTKETQSIALTAPIVTPPIAPAATTIGSGTDSIVFDISEDAYRGNALFTIAIDGTQIGGTQTATALHSLGQDQQFTVDGTFAAGQHTVTVDFLNDAYAGTPQTDRNLYVDSITYAGTTDATNAALLSGGPQSFTIGTTPTPVVTPPVVPDTGITTIGSGPDTLALQISEDAYLGDAQFTVMVNGVAIGGIQTATASHAAGDSNVFDVMGTFNGPNVATIDFLNDLYAGTPETDRNLYVTGAALDGSTVPGAVLTELSAGPMSFSFQGSPVPSTGVDSSPVELNLSEDAYLGNAQFTFSIDGGAASAPQTVTALHGSDQSEAFSLGNSLAGTHDIAVSFINDLYAGTPTTDRNLYVDGISVNGIAVPNATASILGDWTSNFIISVPK